MIPSNDGTHALQPPMTAYRQPAQEPAGNRINWVEALGQKKINPRWDRIDAAPSPWSWT